MKFNDEMKFNGLNYDFSQEDELKDAISNLGDSLWNELKEKGYNVHHSKFSTAMTPLLHIGGSYHLNNAISAGFLSRTAFWKNAVRQSFNLSINLQPYSFVSFNANATWQVKGNVNLGCGLMFLVGPLQFYVLSDYLPVYYSTLQINDGSTVPFVPERQKSFTVRTGLNLVFGRHGYVNKPMLDRGISSWN